MSIASLSATAVVIVFVLCVVILLIGITTMEHDNPPHWKRLQRRGKKMPTAITICTSEDCDNEVPKGRVDLGYDTCLECGSPVKEYTVAPAYNKGAYQLVTRKGVKDIGRK